MTSKHYTNDRIEREKLIKEIGYGNTIKEIVIDKGHKNGPELHTLSDTGIITIYNNRTKKLITKLIARPGQIKKFFNFDEIIPTDLINLARFHQSMSMNMI